MPGPWNYPLPTLPAAVRLETMTLQSQRFSRVFWKGQDPLAPSVGKDNRYDCTPKAVTAGKPFGVLYLGFDLETCWLETVVRASIVRPAGDHILIPAKKMTNRWACELLLEGEMTLVNFADRSLAMLGDTASNVMADSYIRTQVWSDLLHAHKQPEVDGIYYRSRFMSDRFCVALFDRALKKAKLQVQNKRPINPKKSLEIQSIMKQYRVTPI
jgi:hypothetical protein